MAIVALVLASLLNAGGAVAADVRAQVDTVGFATNWADMAACVAASRAAEGLGPVDVDQPSALVAAIMPHDDYLYAGRTAVHLLDGLRAPTWVIFGVCHACRRLGVRDRLLFDDHDAWRVAGVDIAVDTALRERLLEAVGPDGAAVDRERHRAEHSLEALLPWLHAARPEARVVPVLVPGMDQSRLQDLAHQLAAALAAVCREQGLVPGRDLGLLISADAVHYGCEGWGERSYHPFGCDDAGHAAGRAQDVMLADAVLAGPLTPETPARFLRLVSDDANPAYPYRITWCGIYSIPFGLAVAEAWCGGLGRPSLTGALVRYGDSVSDGRLPLAGTRLGVTAPADLTHWVGYPAVGYR